MLQTAAPGGRPSRAESLVVAAVLAAAALLKVVYALRYRVNSDEGQHLHLAWGWTQGLVQYRDVPDNHMPLFHLLFAPVVAAIGERPDVVVLSRLAMLPLYALSLAATFRLARALVDARAAAWTTAAVALLPAFFLTTTEVRADDLSTCLALAGLAILYDARASRVRSLAAGLLLGAAAITSLKAIVLVAALIGGTALVRHAAEGTIAPLPAHVRPIAAAAGLALCPALLLLGLVQLEALGWFVSEVLHRDLVGALAVRKRQLELLLLLPIAATLAWLGARWIVARVGDPLRGGAIGGICATTLLAFVAIAGLSPLLRPQDWLGLYPLLCVSIAALVTLFAPTILEVGGGARGLALLAATELVLLFASAPPWRVANVAPAARIRDVLRLTAPGELVMDLKGETVFRPRAVRQVLEQVTRAQIAAGIVADDIPERLVAAEVAVAVHDSDNLPPRTRRFLAENYVNVGRVRVIGKLLAADDAARFEIAVPGRYVVVSPLGLLPGARIDGAEVGRGIRLESGPHRLDVGKNPMLLAVIWARAVERGYSPFDPPEDPA